MTTNGTSGIEITVDDLNTLLRSDESISLKAQNIALTRRMRELEAKVAELESAADEVA
jgi:alanine-alpha-ketoisovalerate/valine-pyruvate aminotransferase